MPDRNIKVELGPVQETLLIPLWARAKEIEKQHPIVHDPYARDIIARIDYDFSKIETGQAGEHQLAWPIRAYNFDIIVRRFIEQHPDAAVVNIGAGLDTTFQRIDNGAVRWINLDLPDVIALRQQLISDSERETSLAKSVFDFSWLEDLAALAGGRSIMFMAAGVLYYFDAPAMETFFRRLAAAFPSAHLIFDVMSRLSIWAVNRAILKGSGIDSSALLKWHLSRASRLKKWVATLKILEEYPLLSRLPAEHDLSRRTLRGIRVAGLFRLYSMIHVQF
jgi:O-methyltransferase involved in polyketide biosynthesis